VDTSARRARDTATAVATSAGPLGRVSLAAETPRLARRAATRLRGWAGSEVPTLCLIVCLVAIWLVERAAIGQVHAGKAIGYLAFGAVPNATVVGRGSPDQWWRYATSALLHERTTPWQLGVNCCVLLAVSRLFVPLYGRVVFFAVLALATAFGGVTWVAWSALGLASAPDYTVGLSTGLCGVIGVLLMYGYRQHDATQRVRARSIQTIAALGIALITLSGMVVPNLNNMAHAGGLLFGLFAGPFILPLASQGRRAYRWAQLPVMSAVLLLAAIAVGMGVQNLVNRLVGH
jgi:membrane associated rhomboid family serine protease